MYVICNNIYFFAFNSSYFCRNNSGTGEFFAKLRTELCDATIVKALALVGIPSFCNFSTCFSGAEDDLIIKIIINLVK